MKKLAPNETPQRLKALRAAMLKHKLQGYLVPRQDEFQGEYVAAYADRLKWLSGFSGSWGVAIVATRKAAIFVDGRYTVQVREQVDSNLFTPQHLINEPPADWIAKNFKTGDHIGFDPWLMTMAEARRLGASCAKQGVKLLPVVQNLIDNIWHDQPARPASPIEAHPLRHAGTSSADKCTMIVAELKQRRADAIILADPASVAWSLNLRSSDVPHTPFALCYAVVEKSGKATLFADAKRLSPKLKAEFGKAVAVEQPEKLAATLAALGKAKVTVLLDPALTPEHFRIVLEKAGAKIVEAADPCIMPKARKSKAEQKGARDAQIRDGAALCNFLCWLHSEGPKGKLSEGATAEKLHAFRRQSSLLRDLSFESISAAGPNAALPHYHAKGNGSRLKLNQIYLIDSGGQYPDGTTDVTRTVIIGKPSAEMRDRFTRVLKGMITLSLARFPEGTTGAHLDTLARSALWQGGFDFDHGTGHGVGSYLSVHEGPARISKTGNVALQSGMILSNEPGYYKPGHYGIRIENLLLVSPPEKIKGGDRPMLGFETLTWAPIDRNLIDTHLLTRAELQWLDAYHAKVEKLLSPLVSAETVSWLREACSPFEKTSV